MKHLILFAILTFAFGGALAADLALLAILLMVGACGCAYAMGRQDRA